MSITKFPIEFSGDGKAQTTDRGMDQFDLFTNVRPFTLVREPDYGIDARVLLQTPLNNLDQLLGVYLVTLRDKILEYFTNLTVTRATAEFDRANRRILIGVYVQEEGQENKFQFAVEIEE